jgi:alpha-glucosidase
VAAGRVTLDIVGIGAVDPQDGQRWWQGAVLYQVYVRSWRDSDGDGYGDLNGIIGRLDYLAWLGVDCIWLSPTMPSPDEDWGYDVSDYLAVHPELGDMAAMDRLIAEAADRGIRVLLDLVANHTSTAHPWFADAASGRDAARRDYYMWTDPAPDGGPPNNWQDTAGQAAWAWHEPTGQYYLHLFLASQADLNWREPAVHREFEQILRFWFDRGVAGVRIDVAHGLYKDQKLRDNPDGGGLGASWGRSSQAPKYSTNQPETHEVYRAWRLVADQYRPPRLLFGETWVRDLSALAGYYGRDDELQLALNIPFVFAPFSATGLSGVVAQTLARLPAGACPVWTASNHDVGRFPTRWCGGDERKARLALLLLGTLPGAVVLYYGDEIAMTDVTVPPGLRRDTPLRWAGGGAVRDRGRTPMLWDCSPTAGFTAPGVTPWLPVGDAGDRGAAGDVASQRDDPDSVLSFCRALLALRRAEQGGAIGDYEQVPAGDGLWAYRVGGLLVAANFRDEPAPLPHQAGEILLRSGSRTGVGRVLAPWEGAICRPA